MTHNRGTLLERRFLSVRSDEVTHPGGGRITYDWVDAPSMVRVAALAGDGHVLLVEQTHYLPGEKLYQCPGGAIEPGESPEAAARRERGRNRVRRRKLWCPTAACACQG